MKMPPIPKQKPGDESAPYWNISSGDVIFKCTNGPIGSLGGHQIKASGDVEPSVVCPREGCDFHEFIKLDDWTEETRANA